MVDSVKTVEKSVGKYGGKLWNWCGKVCEKLERHWFYAVFLGKKWRFSRGYDGFCDEVSTVKSKKLFPVLNDYRGRFSTIST